VVSSVPSVALFLLVAKMFSSMSSPSILTAREATIVPLVGSFVELLKLYLSIIPDFTREKNIRHSSSLISICICRWNQCNLIRKFLPDPEILHLSKKHTKKIVRLLL
jgi:hypothetical protein